MVATYKYDPWGNPLGIYNASGNSISQTAHNVAAYNPFRYRGYRYDAETGFYYLQSRYYDPLICRFINADSYASTGQGFLGHNMFAYCLNNPVFYADPTGSRAMGGPSHVLVNDGGGSSISSPNASEDEEYGYHNVNIYTADNIDESSEKDQPGKINVWINEEMGNIRIKNSFLIYDSDDKLRILTLIMNSACYDPEIFTRSIDSYKLEWDAHNTLFELCKTSYSARVGIAFMSHGDPDNILSRLMSVDFDNEMAHYDIYDLITAGGNIWIG